MSDIEDVEAVPPFRHYFDTVHSAITEVFGHYTGQDHDSSKPCSHSGHAPVRQHGTSGQPPPTPCSQSGHLPPRHDGGSEDPWEKLGAATQPWLARAGLPHSSAHFCPSRARFWLPIGGNVSSPYGL